MLRPGTDVFPYFGGRWGEAVNRKVYGTKKRIEFSFAEARARVCSSIRMEL